MWEIIYGLQVQHDKANFSWPEPKRKNNSIIFFRIEAQNENDSSRWWLYQSIFLIVTVMTCVAPLIVFLTVKSTILGEVCFIIAFLSNFI